MISMNNMSTEDKDEYNGLRDCQQGRPCLDNQSEAYYNGYSAAYHDEQSETARSIALEH
jgi:hypothetical protein